MRPGGIDTFGGGGDNRFSYKMIIFAMAVMFLFPTTLSIFTDTDSEVNQEAFLDEYYKFTGNHPTREAVWALTGIYTPYFEGSYGYTEDGWLYGGIIGSTSPYQPTQYVGTNYGGPVQLSDGLYKYTKATDDGHSVGDVYTAVTMDANNKSNVFFTPGGKVDQGSFFYYDYTGYRYAFQPLANYSAQGSDGQAVPVVATTTSLSLIWYEFYGASGISGQLVLSGSDSGVAYITAQEIITAFNSVTSTAKFGMTFNGIEMNVYIRLNPAYIAQGMDIQQCYNYGAWEILITSLSTDSNAYTQADYSMNVSEIWKTLIDQITFNTADYGLSGWLATLASLVMVVPLYAALLSIGMTFYPALIMAGILAVFQGWSFLF